jgi:hypothetical protein
MVMVVRAAQQQQREDLPLPAGQRRCLRHQPGHALGNCAGLARVRLTVVPVPGRRNPRRLL